MGIFTISAMYLFVLRGTSFVKVHLQLFRHFRRPFAIMFFIDFPYRSILTKLYCQLGVDMAMGHVLQVKYWRNLFPNLTSKYRQNWNFRCWFWHMSALYAIAKGILNILMMSRIHWCIILGAKMCTLYLTCKTCRKTRFLSLGKP